MSNLQKYYRILGLPHTASLAEVKRSYRKLAMQYHPDKNASPTAKEVFIKITEAYEIINGDRPIPMQRIVSNTTNSKDQSTTSRSTSSRSGLTKEERMKRAEEYQRAKNEKERQYILQLYTKITETFRWTIYKISIALFCLFSLVIVIDDFLPTFYDVEEFLEYTGMEDGIRYTDLVGIQFKSGNIVYVNNNELFPGAKYRFAIQKSVDTKAYEFVEEKEETDAFEVYQVVKSGWLHSEKELVLLTDSDKKIMKLDRNFYTLRYVIVLFLLLPLLNYLTRKSTSSFILRYYLTQYLVLFIFLVLIIGNYRWLHLITFGLF